MILQSKDQTTLADDLFLHKIFRFILTGCYKGTITC